MACFRLLVIASIVVRKGFSIHRSSSFLMSVPTMDTVHSPVGGQNRGEFSRTCGPFPEQRVVMLTVNEEYTDMFQNWLQHAKPFLKSTEHLLVIAEDHGALPALQELQSMSNLQFTVAEHGKLSAVSLAGTSPSAVSLISAPYGTREYGNVVWRRPHHLLSLLERGCTVLYVDVDTVWLKDPFLDIAARPAHDLYLVQDDPNQGRFDWVYFCSCFLYMHPTPANQRLVLIWSQNMRGTKNQHVFNRVLESFGQDTNYAVLPINQYPPGIAVDRYPEASVVHANWVNGHDSKVCFLQQRRLWTASGVQQARECGHTVAGKDAVP